MAIGWSVLGSLASTKVAQRLVSCVFVFIAQQTQNNYVSPQREVIVCFFQFFFFFFFFSLFFLLFFVFFSLFFFFFLSLSLFFFSFFFFSFFFFFFLLLASYIEQCIRRCVGLALTQVADVAGLFITVQ